MVRAKLNEQTVKTALDALSWPQLKAHLDEVTLDEADIDHLIGLVRRNNCLVFKRPSKSKIKVRASLFYELQKTLNPNATAIQIEELSALPGLFETIDDGYQEILGALDQGETATYTGVARVAGALQLAATTYQVVQKAIQDSVAKSQEHIPQAFQLELDGVMASPDTMLGSIVETTTMTIVMESYRNRWHGPDQRITLPTLPDPCVSDSPLSEIVGLAAVNWRHWEGIQQKCRFLGGRLEIVDRADWPEVAPTVTKFIKYSGLPKVVEYDFWANERLQERFIQTLSELRTYSSAERAASGIATPVELMPDGFVSIVEINAAGILSDILGYRIDQDVTEPAGLRLVEWLRGYAALQVLMKERFDASGADGLIPQISHTHLISLLKRVGLSGTKAELFLDRITLKVSSRDLFDHPLIALQGGDYLIFGPALIDADPARVTLSTIGHLGEQLENKGKAFEDSVVAFFKAQGLNVKNCKFKTAEGEFEFDALVEWGTYLFLFECKNRTLSSYNPIQAYYFELSINSAISQTQRLLRGLTNYGAEVLTHTGIKVEGKTVIPCVLNSLPYARAGQTNGIYLTDMSAIQRFFKERYMFVVRPADVDDKIKVIHRVAVGSNWAREDPQPTDFIRHLNDPIQLKLLKGHTTREFFAFSLGQGTVVEAEFLARTEQTLDTMCAIYGVSADFVRSEFEKSRRSILTVKKERAKRVREETRNAAARKAVADHKLLKAQMKIARKKQKSK